jgi:cell division protein FtsB
VIFIILILLIFLIISTWKQYHQTKISEDRLNVIEEQYQELLLREEKLKVKIDRFGTQTGIEEELRSKYDLSREGENTIVIIEKEVEIESDEKPGGLEGIWTTIKNFFQ